MNNSMPNGRRLGAALFTLAAISASPALADQTASIAPELLITAGTMPLPTKEVASSYTIITAADIQRFQYRTVVDALKSVPGVHIVQQGGSGSLAYAFTRGGNSNQTLVLLNGQPVSDPASPSNAFNFAFLTLENVERIEVVRGPQSALYGSQAIGGVINIITKQGTATPSNTLSVEAGSRGSLNTSITSSGSVGKTNYFASLARQATNGNDITPSRYRLGTPEEKDGNEDINGSLQLNSALNELVTASAFAQFGDTRNASDTSFGGIDAGAKTIQLFLSGSIEGKFAGGVWTPKLNTSFTKYHRNDVDYPDVLSVDDSQSNNRGERFTLSADNAFKLADWNLLTIGAEYAHETFTSNGYLFIPDPVWGDYLSVADSAAATSSTAIYGSNHVDLGGRFFATVSGRYDMPKDFGNQFTYSIAPGYYIEETDTRLTASYGTAFKVPALFERYGFTATTYGDYHGNPNLKPEKSRGWEVGVDQGLFGDYAKVGLTYFKSRIEDSIRQDAFFTTSINSPTFHASGVESYIEIDPLPNVSARLDYTYTLIDKGAAATPILRRPRHIVSGTLGWQVDDKTDLGLNVEWVANYFDVYNSPVVFGIFKASPYAVVNISGSHQLTDSVKLTARINNLLNKQYEPADGFQAQGFEAFAGIAYTF
ncbi:MAG: TonB-dependent receptor [Parvibaculum sp.]|uniref:TonB-dependent receptor plug domain-containing protein n=1 Tax=Parvibaculum sp. TaxID=2024848 RepID=UPI003C7631DC